MAFSCGENSMPITFLKGYSDAINSARPLPDPKSMNTKSSKRIASAIENREEALRLDPRIIPSVNPVRAGNIEVAQVRPPAEFTVGIYSILAVKLAVLRLAPKSLCMDILAQEVEGQQRASENRGQIPRSASDLLNRGTMVFINRGIKWLEMDAR